jgi:predicted kinase/diadenosine tetraphosphatase ApaH/serine/threonine PP2A family protein phosphatase
VADQSYVPVRPGTLVVLAGVSGSGKSTFAERNFLPTEIVSSDNCRAILSDNPSNQWVSGSAFKLLHWIVAERVRLKRTTVVDSTALDRRFRRDLLKLAAEHNARTMLVIFETRLDSAVKRDAKRSRPVGKDVIQRQFDRLPQTLEDVKNEPWDSIQVLGDDQAASALVVRPTGTFDLRYLAGPFDIIGDIHGCLDELRDLLEKLGYVTAIGGNFSHPQGRTLIFLGDLADRGPYNAEVFELVMGLVEDGRALYTPGNHCNMLLRYLRGTRKSLSWGLDKTVRDIDNREREYPGYRERVARFIESAPSYLWLDAGSLVVAHGGIKEEMIGKDNGRVRAMVLYGDVTGKTNTDGTPERLDWAKDYHGAPAIVYGHTPGPGPTWRNNTVNIDQGCVFGGWLSAVRWPEREAVQVRAHHAYFTERTPAFLRDAEHDNPAGESATRDA